MTISNLQKRVSIYVVYSIKKFTLHGENKNIYNIELRKAIIIVKNKKYKALSNVDPPSVFFYYLTLLLGTLIFQHCI